MSPGVGLPEGRASFERLDIRARCLLGDGAEIRLQVIHREEE